MPSNIMQPTLQPAVATQPLSNNNFRGNHFQPNNMRPHGNFAPPQQPQMVANQFNPQQPQQMVANGNQGGDNSNNLMQKVPAVSLFNIYKLFNKVLEFVFNSIIKMAVIKNQSKLKFN